MGNLIAVISSRALLSAAATNPLLLIAIGGVGCVLLLAKTGVIKEIVAKTGGFKEINISRNGINVQFFETAP